MTPPADAAGMAELIARLGLADEFTVKDLVATLPDKKAGGEPLVRLMERRGLLSPFQGAKLLKGETDGYFLGGYRILYRIASGSFGKVYRGDDPRTGQIVAIKVLRRKWLEGDGRNHRVAQFEREGRLGLTLQHPNIVAILAVSKDTATDSYFIVMEFVEGGSLRDFLNIRKKMAPPEALRIIEECVAGLAHAYERGLTHRDIKPTNILIGTDGVAKLVDFGLAELTQQGATTAMMLESRNKAKSKQKEKEDEAGDRTLDYAGLEKATGAKAGDIRSDIYFLGHALFEMLTGEPLMARTKDRRMALEPRRFELVEPTLATLAEKHGLPPTLRGLVARAVALEPMRRFQTPGQFLEAIRAVRAELAPPETDHDEAEHDEAKEPTDVDTPGHPEPEADVPAEPTDLVPEPPAAPTGPARPDAPPTLYVVEEHPKLQEAFRSKLGRLGFRVEVVADPARALARYRKEPYRALLIDAGTAGVAGAAVFGKVLAEAKAGGHRLAAVLMLNENQADLGKPFAGDPRAAVMVRPVTMKQFVERITALVPELAAKAEPTG